MKFVWGCVLVGAALIAASLQLSGCGSEEEELDLDRYFQRLENISGAHDARVDALREESQGVGENIEVTRHYFAGFNAIVRQTLNDMKDMHPPAQAQEAHNEHVAAAAELLALLEDFSDQLAGVESPSGLEAVLAQLDEPPLDTAMERAANACLQVQTIADENGIEVDLACK